MKRIRVPEGAVKAYEAAAVDEYHMIHDYRKGLEASFQFISEHPQVPTDEQWAQLFRDYAKVPHGHPPIEDQLKWTLDQWQRMCFQEEEPEEAQCSICGSPIWKVENGTWSHWGGFPDHLATLEPEIPAEIKDLLSRREVNTPTVTTGSSDSKEWVRLSVSDKDHDAAVIEAYRRGLRKGEQK